MITEAIFNSAIPNIMIAVKGEKTVYDKMQPFLMHSQQWVIDTFTGQTLFAALETRENTDTTKILVQHVIIYDAFARGIPSLDLILTPNGFGIVSNQNVAPASKERVERLIKSMYADRDNVIHMLLQQLPSETGWTSTDQGKFFGNTLFSDLTYTRVVVTPEEYKSDWDFYLAIRDKAIIIEDEIAEQYVSPELMDKLRYELQTNTGSILRHQIAKKVQNIEFQLLRGDGKVMREHNALRMVVNVIRNNDTEFPEWHSSETAKLYDPPVYVNLKEDKGYWF